MDLANDGKADASLKRKRSKKDKKKQKKNSKKEDKHKKKRQRTEEKDDKGEMATTVSTTTTTSTSEVSATTDHARAPKEKKTQSTCGHADSDAGGDGGGGEEEEARAFSGHTWVCDEADHCETPLDAYADIAPLLRALASKLGKKPADLRIYDPYFCAGRTTRLLTSLGFPNVYNKCEDCYQVWKEGKTPAFDVVVTNPPYSADHIERCMRFCLQSKLPWLLLIPNYCIAKEWYVSLGASPVFVCPVTRYMFQSPSVARPGLNKKAKVSPYICLWYIQAPSGAVSSAVDRGDYTRGDKKGQAVDTSSASKPLLCWSEKFIPDRMRDQNDPSRRRLRKKQRDRLKKRKDGGDVESPPATSLPTPKVSSLRAFPKSGAHVRF